ncbi:MAG: sodium:calcium antiporter [Deltaproteobacteria bacterium]|nr:sodium:calcium antiporter [Deltaproteobacteria bacterium]MBW2359829.1 sodium:calcium antiporter [Deltaproteobacteria bacterium]
MSTVWIEFAAALGLVAFGGARLSRCGEAIGHHTGLGTTGVGLFLLATVTSLPELVTGVSAVQFARAPDIAVGVILGSCVFNVMIIAILDFALERVSLYDRVSRTHVLSACFGVLLIGTVGFCMFGRIDWAIPGIASIGLYTPVLLFGYWVAVHTLMVEEGRFVDPEFADRVIDEPEMDSAGAWRGFALAALAVVAAGIWLPFVGERIAVQLAVQDTFAGTLFIAFATSLPEIVVALAALRQGAPNLAVSNVLGSNIFNILILVPLDVLYREGPLLAGVSELHLLSVVSAVTMSAVAMLAVLVRPRQNLFPRMGSASAVLVTIYLLNLYVMYVLG